MGNVCTANTLPSTVSKTSSSPMYILGSRPQFSLSQDFHPTDTAIRNLSWVLRPGCAHRLYLSFVSAALPVSQHLAHGRNQTLVKNELNQLAQMEEQWEGAISMDRGRQAGRCADGQDRMDGWTGWWRTWGQTETVRNYSRRTDMIVLSGPAPVCHRICWASLLSTVSRLSGCAGD